MRLSAIGVVVADMKRALDFYRLLGFEFPDGAENEDHVQVELPGGAMLMFDTEELVRQIDPGRQAPQGSPRVALGFDCSTPAEVDRVYASLIAAGSHGHKEPWDAFWGQRYATLLDPDGNGIDLYAALEAPVA